MATILMAGSSGFLGTALATRLTEYGHTVRRLVRREAYEPNEIAWRPASGALPENALDGVTHVVNLAGAGVADKRWTASRKQELLNSRIAPTALLAARIAAQNRSDLTLVNASAVGYYADRGEELLTESSSPGDSFLAGLVQSWEDAAAPACSAGARVVHLRTGIVLDPAGGALAHMLPILRRGVAGSLGSGKQWWPWITRDDVLGAIVHLLLNSAYSGPANLCAPHPRRNGDLMRVLAAAVGKSAVLPAPAFALRAALGGFAAELLGSQRVQPAALIDDGYKFEWPDLELAAEHLLGSA